jgi:hypothetical protein
MGPVKARLQLAAARYALGTATSEELVQVADSVLDEGLYLQALGELATLGRPVISEAGPLFENALVEIGLRVPSREEAIATLLRNYVGAIAGATVAPEEGLRRIIQDVYFPADLYGHTKQFVGDSHGLQHLIGCFYTYDDVRESEFGEETIKALDQQVVTLAKQWLAERGV